MSEDRLGKIERLARLLDSGSLTREEFEAEKARILEPPPEGVTPRLPPAADTTGPIAAGSGRALRWVLPLALVAAAAIGVFAFLGLAPAPMSQQGPQPEAVAVPPSGGDMAANASLTAVADPQPPAPELEPENGMILSAVSPGDAYLGWTSLGGGYWGDADREECCFKQFLKGNRRIVALTQILSRGPQGGVERERIIALLKLTLEAGEEEAADCYLDGSPVMVAFINESRGTARGVFTDGRKLQLRSWKHRDNPDCTVHVD